jgi:hypothetical protein
VKQAPAKAPTTFDVDAQLSELEEPIEQSSVEKPAIQTMELQIPKVNKDKKR